MKVVDGSSNSKIMLVTFLEVKWKSIILFIMFDALAMIRKNSPICASTQRNTKESSDRMWVNSWNCLLTWCCLRRGRRRSVIAVIVVDDPFQFLVILSTNIGLKKWWEAKKNNPYDNKDEQNKCLSICKLWSYIYILIHIIND